MSNLNVFGKYPQWIHHHDLLLISTASIKEQLHVYVEVVSTKAMSQIAHRVGPPFLNELVLT